MTQTQGPRPGGGTRSEGKRYDKGTPGLEERDAILVALHAGGHNPSTNSDGYMWFAPCANEHDAIVRISSGKTIEMACLAWREDERCTKDQVIRAYDLEHLVPTEATNADLLRKALVDTGGLDDIPDPVPLVGEDILFVDSLAWLVGKPGCGKSFVALDLAGCVATGERWHDGYPVARGPVLYVVAEGVRGTKKRVRAWEQAIGHPMTGVSFLPVAVQSAIPAQWDALVTVAQEMRPVLIILDTQARITVGVEENSNTAMGQFVDQAERLRKATGACVLIVHHIGRTGDTGRGATTLDGAMSTIIRCTKDEDQVTLECTKSKDGAEWEDIRFRAVETADSIILVGDYGASSNSGRDALARRKWVHEWWKVHEDEPVSVTTLVESGVVAKTTFHRSKNDLIKQGLAVREGAGNSLRYRLTGDPGSR